MHEKRKKSKPFKALVALLLATVIVAGSFFTYAWLERKTEITNETIISDFSIKTDIYFLNGNGADNKLTVGEIVKEKPYVSPDGKTLIKTNLINKNAENYIGNLRVVLTYTGSSPAYVRAKIFEQWSEDDEFIENANTPYTIPLTNEEIFIYEKSTTSIITPSFIDEKTTQQGTGWFDNRHVDFGLYYDAPVYPNVKATTVKLLLINGISEENIFKMGNVRQSVEMQFMIVTDAVQPNRYREFFKIEKLPWE